MPSGWHKSSRSETMNCLEFNFIKSTKSEMTSYVEAAHRDGSVLVRNSKRPNELTLSFTEDEWTAFVDGLKAA